MLSRFSYVYWPSLCVLFGEMSIHVLPFFNQIVFLILSYMSFLYILDVNPLSGVSLASIFSHSVGCLFILLMVSFTMQKLFVWCSSICLFFLLFPLPTEAYPDNITTSDVKEFIPIFCSRSFMVLGLTFKCLIHFEFTLVYGVRN